jgi:hypothetical protein
MKCCFGGENARKDAKAQRKDSTLRLRVFTCDKCQNTGFMNLPMPGGVTLSISAIISIMKITVMPAAGPEKENIAKKE